ncbi:MAG: amino acid adenylation domain-containing protein [Anaerolineae bacterium]|nr:amino acid adenylation domain-containing protein [Anaerolineae bacterium]
MTVTPLLDHLAQQGIKLWADGDRLRIRGPEEALTSELQNTIAENKVEILSWLKADHGESRTLPPIRPLTEQRYQPFPLTDIQQAFWLGQTAGLELNNGYHAYLEFECIGLDIPRLNQAWQRLIDRHEMLRAIVLPTGQQQILETVPDYQIQEFNLVDQDETTQQQHLKAILDEMSHQVLPLAEWPLFDIRVTHLRSQCCRLHLSLALITFDGGSFFQLLQEWEKLYQEPTTRLTPLNISYRDYALWEESVKETEIYQQARDYWLKRLDTLPPAPKLPLKPLPAGLSQPQFVRRTNRLDPASWQTLQQQANAAGVTPSVILLAAFAQVLTTWTNQPQFTLNLTLFNRNPVHPQINEIIGDFTSANLVEIDNSGSRPLIERAKQIHRQLWQDLDHRAFSGVQVIRELGRRSAGMGSALMPIVFSSFLPLKSKVGPNYSLNLFGGKLVYNITQTPQVLLDHQVMEENGTLTFNWDAVEEQFPLGLLDSMFEAYCGLLQRLSTDQTTWVEPSRSLVPLTQLAQRAKINATDVPFPDEMLHTLFLKQVATRADAPAVIWLQGQLTYQEIYARANQVGHWLRTHGARPNTLVAVVMKKGWEQIVGVMGILMSGAAYLPIDPDLPIERQHYLLEHGNVKLALTQSKIDHSQEWPEQIQRLPVDQQPFDEGLPPPEIVQKPEDLAYVLYTSGSTGKPKGVMIEHRNIVNRMIDVANRFGLKPEDRAIALTALHHDLSVFDIFCMLSVVGGTIVLPEASHERNPAHWVDLIVDQGVTLWNSVPAFMQMMIEHLEHNPASVVIPPSLRWIILSGDFIPVMLPDRLRRLLPEVEIISAGGPTETTVWDICYPIGEVNPDWRSIPYGQPMANARYDVFTDYLEPCPTWVPGELYIAGEGLGRGYWRDEERTQASFITHPETGQRLYRSGDLGRYWPDGNIEILGRKDFQVKILGHRIELGEIEFNLCQHPHVNEAVVNVVGDREGHKQLVAYVVLDEPAQNDPEPMPEAYSPDAEAGVLLEPVERLAFKLTQAGIRSFDNSVQNRVSLPTPEFDPTRRATYLSRQSYRQFVDESIPLIDFSIFLSCLSQMPLADAPLPKYRYPSAGNLYPVQTYLYIKPGRVTDLAGGYYYYHPAQHQLVWLASDDECMADRYVVTNRPIFEQGAFALFLIGHMEAIRPMYGELSLEFCLLEAGYISQLLMMEAPQHQLGLCPIGVLDATELPDVLGLTSSHRLIHSLVGGHITFEQQSRWLQDGQQPDASSWQSQLQSYLAEKLPDYMVPTVYLELAALPLSVNGKVDRTALPVPDASNLTEPYIAPASEMEHTISAILKDIAALEQISVTSNFAELGLDSVLMVRINNELQQRLNQKIPITALFKHATIRTLAQYLSQTEESLQEQTAIQEQSRSRGQARLANRQQSRRQLRNRP